MSKDKLEYELLESEGLQEWFDLGKDEDNSSLNEDCGINLIWNPVTEKFQCEV